MEITRNLAIKSFIWKFLERSGAQVITFIVTIILARLLLPEEYGVIALITIFINICNVIVDGGLNTALIQKQHADDKDFSTIFYFSLLTAFGLYGILFLCAPYVSLFYNIPILTDVLRVLGINLLFFAVNSIQRAYVAKHMLFSKLCYSSLIAALVSGTLGIVSAYNGYGVWALVIQSVSVNLLSCIIMWVTIKWRPVLTFAFERFLSLFDFGWKIFLANLITVVFVEIRKVFIGRLYSPSDLAYYDKGEQFPSLIMNNLFTSMQTVLLPTFSAYQDDKTKVKNMMRRSTKLSCFIIYPLMVGLIVVAEPLVRLLLTDKWIAIVPFIQIMCIANFFRPITISNWEAIKALGYSGITLKLEVIKKIADVIILLFTLKLGVHAIAWGVVLFNFICIFINLAPTVKLLNYKILEQLRDAIPSLLLSILMGCIIYLFKLIIVSDLTLLIIQVISGILVYIFLCFIFKEESFTYTLKLVKEKVN